MRSGFAWIVAAVGSVLIAGAANSSAADFKYVGAKKCKTCHKKELIGDQYGKWQEAKHSKALETLKGEKAAEIAKEKGITGPASESEKCLKCHVTAYGADAAAFDKKPLNPADGVQCESCHGPGSAYKKKKTMADHDKSLAAGMRVESALFDGRQEPDAVEERLDLRGADAARAEPLGDRRVALPATSRTSHHRHDLPRPARSHTAPDGSPTRPPASSTTSR